MMPKVKANVANCHAFSPFRRDLAALLVIAPTRFRVIASTGTARRARNGALAASGDPAAIAKAGVPQGTVMSFTQGTKAKYVVVNHCKLVN